MHANNSLKSDAQAKVFKSQSTSFKSTSFKSTSFKSTSFKSTSFKSSYSHKFKPYKKFKPPINLFNLCNKLSENNPDFINTDIWQTAMNNKCYIHSENNTNIKEVLISYLPVSNTFYNTSKNVLDLLNNCADIESKWVSLPAYAIQGSKHKVADFQLATTGSKSSLDSNYDQTSIRECGEENGILVQDEDLVGYSTLPDHDNKHVESFVYFVKDVKHAQSCNTFSKKTDNYNEKIMSWVIFNNPEDIIHRKRINIVESGDSAGELTVVMRVSDLKNLIRLCF